MYHFLSGTATGNVITVVSGVVAFAVKLVFDKIDASQAENSKRFDASQTENSKRFDASEKKLDLLLSTVAPEMATMKTHIAWMRGAYSVVYRGHHQSDQGTKSSTPEPSADEDSSATNP